jgi:hypothetical protein
MSEFSVFSRVGKAGRLRHSASQTRVNALVVPTRHPLRTPRPGRVGTQPKRAALPTLQIADEVIE